MHVSDAVLVIKGSRERSVRWIWNIIKSELYVLFFSGGLAEEVDEKVLHAAFIPFGDITDIQIPLDYETGDKHTNIHKIPSSSSLKLKHTLYK